MKLYNIILCLITAFAVVACSNGKDSSASVENVDSLQDSIETNDGKYVKVDTFKNLIIYYPQYSTIDLACGEMPSKEHSTVIFCAAAAFTGSYLDNFKHTNVAGGHVSGGKYFSGYECHANTGCFAFYGDKTWEFVEGDTTQALKKAADTGGMGFSQILIIHNGKTLQYYRVNPKNNKDMNEFRALCERDGKLCIVDSRGFVNFRDFVKELEQLGVTNAIYMDMGEGWNYSWWRHSNESIIEIHSTPHSYTTNWITFYK